MSAGSIGLIRVTGVDAATARTLGPAIEAGLAAAVDRLPPGSHPDLVLRVAHGATAEDIVSALIAGLVE